MTKKLIVVFEFVFSCCVAPEQAPHIYTELLLVARMKFSAKKRYLFLPEIRVKTVQNVSDNF